MYHCYILSIHFLKPRPKTLLPSNLHLPPSTIAWTCVLKAIVGGGGCMFDGSSVLGRGAYMQHVIISSIHFLKPRPASSSLSVIGSKIKSITHKNARKIVTYVKLTN